MIRRVIISDRPLRIHPANYISRLRRLRHEIALMLTEIDEGLERLQKEQHGQENAPGRRPDAS